MKKMIIALVLFLSANSVFSKDAVKRTWTSSERTAVLERMKIKRTGGILRTPGVQKGCLAFINFDASKIKSSHIQNMAKRLSQFVHVDVKYYQKDSLVSQREIQKLLGTMKVNAAVLYVWDEHDSNGLLFAPEQNWAIVNVATLMEPGVSAEKFKSRFDKETLRAFAYICGAGTSMGGDGLMTAHNVTELDKEFPDLSMDILGRFPGYLRGIGVVPYKEVTYKTACLEGWAPAPTNAIQKAIWDKVHQLPTKPIAIKPESKPVKD